MGSDVTIRRFGTEWDDFERLDNLAQRDREDLNWSDPYRSALRLTQAALLFVALDGDEMVGFVSVVRGTGPAAHAGTLRIHVAASHRAQGVGSMLMTHALPRVEWCLWLRRLVATPYLPDDGSGARKVAFFRRHGFEFEGVARQFACKGGELVDAALMARLA